MAHAHNSDVCRLCLAFDVHLIPITGYLQIVYEKLTTTPLCTSDGKPVTACYICHTQLKKCYKLILTSVRAEKVLTSLVASKTKVTKSSVSQVTGHGMMPFGKLTCSKVKHIIIDVTPTVNSSNEVKEEPKSPLQHIKTEINDEFEEAPEFPITCDIGTVRTRDEEESNHVNNIPSMSVGETQSVDTVVNVEIKREIEDTVGDVEIKGEVEDDSTNTGTPAQQDSPHEDGLFVCPYCQRRFQIGSDFVAHIRMHRDGVPIEVINSTPAEPPPPPPNPEDSLINCKYCDRKFKFASDFDRHIRMHTGERPYSCNLCDLRFKLRSHLKRHSKTHSDEKPHRCEVCQRTFNESSSLKRHSRYHTGEKPYKCNICKKSFSDLSSMKRHLKTHTGEKTEKSFKCGSCPRRFVDIDSLKSHASMHTAGKPFQCSVCNRYFNTNYNLQMHLKTHIKLNAAEGKRQDKTAEL